MVSILCNTFISFSGYYVQDLNGHNNTGFMIAQTTSKNGVRFSTARAYLRPARDRENLHILLKTNAARVLIDPLTKIAEGVEIINSKTGKRRQISASKEIVLSGGAIGSPHILLLSGVGPQEDLMKVIYFVVFSKTEFTVNGEFQKRLRLCCSRLRYK